MNEVDIDTQLKVIVVGNGQVGKSSMISRFAKGVFTAEYKKTLAVDFLEKQATLPNTGDEITYFLWDTAGQEEYDAITRAYYRGAGAAILAFSTVDRASFDAIESWYNKVQSECSGCVIVLVQNKIDLIAEASVSPEEVESLARKLGIRLYRTCVKDNRNVDEVFTYLGQEFIRRGGEASIGAKPVTDLNELSSSPVAKTMPRSNIVELVGSEAAVVADAGTDHPTTNGKSSRPAVRRTTAKKQKISSFFTKCSVI